MRAKYDISKYNLQHGVAYAMEHIDMLLKPLIVSYYCPGSREYLVGGLQLRRMCRYAATKLMRASQGVSERAVMVIGGAADYHMRCV